VLSYVQLIAVASVSEKFDPVRLEKLSRLLLLFKNIHIHISSPLNSVPSLDQGGRPALPVRDYHKTKALIKRMLTARMDPRPESESVV